MSLSRLAMRLAAVRALRGNTFADDRVFDSAMDPIEMTVAEQRQPFLVVTTDQHDSSIVGRQMFGGEQSCELVIESAIADSVEVDGQSSFTIPNTDAGMELILDVLEHQVMAALTFETTDWSKLWVKLVPKIRNKVSRRGASSDHGLRFAARQLVLTCDLVESPIGEDQVNLSNGAWASLRTLLTASGDPNLPSIWDLISRTAMNPASRQDWQIMANGLGVATSMPNALGNGPLMPISGDRQGPPIEPVV